MFSSLMIMYHPSAVNQNVNFYDPNNPQNACEYNCASLRDRLDRRGPEAERGKKKIETGKERDTKATLANEHTIFRGIIKARQRGNNGQLF